MVQMKNGVRVIFAIRDGGMKLRDARARRISSAGRGSELSEAGAALVPLALCKFNLARRGINSPHSSLRSKSALIGVARPFR